MTPNERRRLRQAEKFVDFIRQTTIPHATHRPSCRCVSCKAWRMLDAMQPKRKTKSLRRPATGR